MRLIKGKVQIRGNPLKKNKILIFLIKYLNFQN